MTSPDAAGHLTTDELFRQHAGFVARFLSRLGVPSDQLEDALQEVFLVAHRNGGYRPGLAKPTSYLANIALRAAAQHRRRDGVARQRHSDAALEHMPGENEDPARALQLRRDLERLQRALQRLPEELCTTLLLVEVEGESCVSVAAGLGCPVGTIYWRLHRARKQLQLALRALDAPQRRPAPARPALEERAQPVRSWMIWCALDGEGRSEGSRLLRLAREQPSSMAVEQLIARHHELIRAGAQPAWASGLATQSASWLAVLGTGPIAAVAAGCAIIAASVLGLQARTTALAPEHEVAAASAGIDRAEKPARPIAAIATIATKPLDAPEQRAADTAAAPIDARDRARAQRASRLLTPPRASDATADALAALSPRRDEPATSGESAPHELASRSKAAPARRAALDASDEQIGRALSDEELAEMRAIARAERLLADDPKRALALTRAMAAGFPRGHFHEERAYLEVIALHNLGRIGEMREKASVFLGAYPAGLYSERVRTAVADRGE